MPSYSGIWTLSQQFQAVGQGLWPPNYVLDGTFGIFALGSNCSGGRVTTRNKYTYSGCVVSTGGAATVASRSGAAAGNSTVGIFALGYTGVGCCLSGTTIRDKYTYSGCVVSAGTAANTPSFSGYAAGNSTVGVFALGIVGQNCCGFIRTANRNKYTYSGDINGSATAATTVTSCGAATGNSTVGIFALGNIGATSTTRNKYTYSGDTNGSATAATQASQLGAAAGTSTVGIFALGFVGVSASTTRNKYTYSGDTNAAATASTAASIAGSAAGNSTVGIFAVGNSIATRDRYTYSGCVVAAGGAATVGSRNGSAASNGIAGITL